MAGVGASDMETLPLGVLFGIVSLVLRKYKIQINFIFLNLETYRR